MRASTLSETRGFLKALVETESDRILGFTAFGVSAAEVMISVQIAMTADVAIPQPTGEGNLAVLKQEAVSR